MNSVFYNVDNFFYNTFKNCKNVQFILYFEEDCYIFAHIVYLYILYITFFFFFNLLQLARKEITKASLNLCSGVSVSMECKEGVSEGELNIYIIIIKEGQQQNQ